MISLIISLVFALVIGLFFKRKQLIGISRAYLAGVSVAAAPELALAAFLLAPVA